MEILWTTLDFALKGLIVFLVTAASAAFVFAAARRRRVHLPQLEVRALNRRLDALGDGLRSAMMDRKAYRAMVKQRRAEKAKAEKPKAKVYVLEFDGDILATQVERMREEVTAIVTVATPDDEVVVKVESGGGAVPHYGLAAAQLQRLRDRKIKVTACIDRVAASGGYLMACVADTIVAAPFAVIGSIGVVAQIPNVHRLLKKHDIDVEEITAGKFKRTISVVGEITPQGRAKLKEQLEETHVLFKDFVKQHRPQLDLEKVATGEYWLATTAKELGLVDALGTSDDYLLQRAKDAEVFKVTFRSEKPWRDRLGRFAAKALLEWLVPLKGSY
ncbi:MAG: protease SohB [Archangiaceae bacterium]|nr:protease SohB [Archangiaceae bacterium]